MASYEQNNSYSLKTLNLVKNIGKGTSTGVSASNVPNVLSLIGAFEDLVIYHDINEIATSGYITIKEQGNLIKTFPIVGWERLDVEFSLKAKSSDGNVSDISTPYKRSFFVYAVDEMAETSDTKKYALHFADLSALINVSSRLEHRYKGKAEDIIKEICGTDMFTSHGIKNSPNGTSTAMPLIVNTSTKFQMDYISPCWKPFDFINRIASLAVSSNGTFNDCLFFQQTDGNFYFTDYLTLFSGQPVEFKKHPTVDTQVTDKYVINDYVLNKLFNTQEQAMSGMFGIVAKIVDFSNLSINSFVNYYYSGDVNATNTKYSLIPVTELNEVESEKAYIDTMISGYVKNNNGDPRFSAIKQSPSACIATFSTGFDQSSIERCSTGTTQGVAYETARHAYANGLPCHLNMRTKSAIFTLNPCTDLKLGQLVKINMGGTPSEKEEISMIDEFLNGTWYIGKIKYHLTLTEIEVDTECYSTSLNLQAKR